jgi:segregation and condensation protein B
MEAMSSRKRKKRSRDESSGESAATESQSVEGELADDESSEEQPGEQAEEPREQEADEPQPAVSEISELKPRRKRKRAAEEEQPEPDPAASESAEVVASEADEEEDEEDFADDSAKEAPKTRAQLKRVIESLIFVSDQVITAVQLGRIAKTKVVDVREVLAELSVDYESRGIDLIEVNGGYQFRSAAASAAYVRALVAQKPVRLTRAQLETLALIAYRQPITRPEVDDVRGVDSGSAIKVLLDRDLIKILGRKDDAGRPLLYGTTPFFLEFFGMNTMQELPTLREFTELSDEHRELFKAKTNDIGDPSAESDVPIAPMSEEEPEVEARSDEGEAESVVEPEANDDVISDHAPQPEPEPDSVVEPEVNADDDVVALASQPEPDSAAQDGTDSEIELESENEIEPDRDQEP